MNNDNEVLIWTCEECGKVIKSLYQTQLDINIKQHEFVHDIAEK